MTGDRKCPFRAFQPCAERGCALYIPNPQYEEPCDRGWCALTAIGMAALGIGDKFEDGEVYVNVNIQE